MTVNRPPRDAHTLLAEFVAGAADIRRDKALTHRELARAGHEAALTYNELEMVLEHVAAEREVEKLEMEAVLSYVSAGMELVSQSGPLETLDRTKLAKFGARLKGGGRGAGRGGGTARGEGEGEGGGASGAGREAQASGEGGEEKQPAFRGQIGNSISTLWGTANQMVPLPEGENEAVQQIKEGAAGAQRAAQSALTASGDTDDETQTEESMGGMLRKLMKGGQSV